MSGSRPDTRFAKGYPAMPPDTDMRIGFTRTFYRTYNGGGLAVADRDRCMTAIERFSRSPMHPGLDFKRLGPSPRHNHCSIRASRELRVIVAVDGDERFEAPRKAVFANLGHHDDMYDWSRRQNFHTSADDTGFLKRFGGSSPERTVAEAMSFREWQLFLHPEQRHLVRETFSGEALIKGGPGTGKTVIAAHRATYLGRKFPSRRILVTMFSKSLSVHMKGLISGIPDAPDNIDVLSINQMVWRLTKSGIDNRANDACFRKAYGAVIPGTALERLDPMYLYHEIERILRGRDTDRASYLDTGRFQRAGRRIGFKRREREICWKLKEAWDREMRAAGTMSWKDALNRAVAIARQETPRWRAVIVDEAQDLTASDMALARALVAGAPDNPVPEDGLLFVGDPGQRLDYGVHLPVWAGLDFTDRTFSLGIGYRTPRLVMRAAAGISMPGNALKPSGKVAAGLSGGFGDVSPPVKGCDAGEGHKPVFIHSRTELGKAREIIGYLLDKDGMAPEEIGMFLPTNNDARRAMGWLTGKGIACASLREMVNGKIPGQGIRVGTLDRCKGMDFRVVLVLRVGRSNFPFRPGGGASPDRGNGGRTDGAEPRAETLDEEDRIACLNRLRVGMTRARERVFLIADEAPCEEIENVYDLFDWYPKSRPFRMEDIRVSGNGIA